MILFNASRMNQIYTGGDTVASSNLVGRLASLAQDPGVNGVVIDLDSYPEINDAYQEWDADPGNPQAANLVARTIKSLIYSRLESYPSVKHIVVVGDDAVIPQRRLEDLSLVANERTYLYYDNPAMAGAGKYRYYLSDDYYAASLPIGVNGREVYLPQYGIGRLVESPGEIAGMIDSYLVSPVLSAQNALVTGYDFLIDEADAIHADLSGHGVTPIDTLISPTWTAGDFRTLTFGAQTYDLVSLNSHFDHFSFFPNDPTDVLATEFGLSSNLDGALVFSVGCHSGLNMPDGGATLTFTGADFAQTFARRKATFIGNTGFGYGDGDLLAYSERLMLDFTQELGYNPNPGQAATLPTVGGALTRAKQRYANSLGANAMTNYDEKVLAEMTLYGLPMLKVSVPIQTSAVPGGDSLFNGQNPPTSIGGPPGVNAYEQHLTFAYTPHAVSGPDRSGTYYTIAGEDGLLSTGARPLLPQTTRNFSSLTQLAHGVLLTGGSFTEIPDFDPVIVNIVAQEVALDSDGEGIYLSEGLYPATPVALNRFFTADGAMKQRVVIEPGQYQSTSLGQSSSGILRLYDSLDLIVYADPGSQTDFVAPFVWQVSGQAGPTSLDFTVRLGEVDTIEYQRDRGLDVTAEAYPYSAGYTEISSALLDQFVTGPDSDFSKLMLVSTGERLTRATFTANRKPGNMVILFLNTPEMEALAMTSPLTTVASDGRLERGKGHPRTAGTSGRTLGYYVRETKQISLMDAIRKLSLMPAQRLEKLAPVFRNKGRLEVGADADITVFDPSTVTDKSTYQQPALPSEGFLHILVNGVPVVVDGAVKEGTHPGQGARAPIH
jgi:hypothetical protein